MSAKRNLFILSVIILISACRKDDKIVEDDTLKEIVDPAMYETEISMNGYSEEVGFIRGGYTGPKTTFVWQLKYRLAKAVKKRNFVFYPIEKSWLIKAEYYECSGSYSSLVDHWKKEHDWQETNKFYRYDANLKKSFIYNGTTDLEPELIMDFNLEIGQDWQFNETDTSRFTISDKFEFESNGETYPALVVKASSSSKLLYKLFSPTFIITPLNPNPLLFGENYKKIIYPEWEIFKFNNESEPEDWIHIRPGNYYLINPRAAFIWKTNEIPEYELEYSNKGTISYIK